MLGTSPVPSGPWFLLCIGLSVRLEGSPFVGGSLLTPRRFISTLCCYGSSHLPFGREGARPSGSKAQAPTLAHLRRKAIAGTPVVASQVHRKAESRSGRAGIRAPVGCRAKEQRKASQGREGVSGSRRHALSHCSVPVCSPGLRGVPMAVATHHHGGTPLCDTVMAATCHYAFGGQLWVTCPPRATACAPGPGITLRELLGSGKAELLDCLPHTVSS